MKLFVPWRSPAPSPGCLAARLAGPGDDDDDDETPIGDPPDDDEGDDWDDDDEDEEDEEPLQAVAYCAAAWPRVWHPGTMAPQRTGSLAPLMADCRGRRAFSDF